MSAISRRRGATPPEALARHPWEVAMAVGLVVGAVGASLLLLLG